MENNKLPIEFKQKWIEALRSGKYKQGKFRLFDQKTDTYCCLGVAGDIVGLSGMNNKCIFTDDSVLKEQASALLPPLFLNQVVSHGILDTLMDMNDNKHSFDEIANWIEQNL